jgi:5'-phosphate synthase pdxT subunit
MAAPLTVGVLALQGAFHEHMQHLTLLPAPAGYSHVAAVAVRSAEALAQCHALVIPGGESTAIALAAQRASLLEPLRAWVRDGRPTWGTCAGMILLAREAAGGKRGGQHLLGGIDVRVGRNGFGTQVSQLRAVECCGVGER